MMSIMNISALPAGAVALYGIRITCARPSRKVLSKAATFFSSSLFS